MSSFQLFGRTFIYNIYITILDTFFKLKILCKRRIKILLILYLYDLKIVAMQSRMNEKVKTIH